MKIVSSQFNMFFTIICLSDQQQVYWAAIRKMYNTGLPVTSDTEKMAYG
jgi:hypothetical protein